MSNKGQDFNTPLVDILPIYIEIFTFGLIGIAIPAVIALQHFSGLDPLAWLLEFIWSGQKVMAFRTNDLGGRTFAGVMCTVPATLVCLFNFWRYLQHGEEGGGSGLPVIGSFFLLGAVAVMPGSVFWGYAFLVLYAMDTDGFGWFGIIALSEWWVTGRPPR